MSQGELPKVGMVIRHMYLWHREAKAGQEEGAKARPCVIVDVSENSAGDTQVYIAPLTHTAPDPADRALLIPPLTKRRLGLDEERSWIITNDLNRFTWRGPDVRPTPQGSPTYGHLPPGLTKAALDGIREHARDRALRTTDRDDPELNERIRQHRESLKGRNAPPRDRDR